MGVLVSFAMAMTVRDDHDYDQDDDLVANACALRFEREDLWRRTGSIAEDLLPQDVPPTSMLQWRCCTFPR